MYLIYKEDVICSPHDIGLVLAHSILILGSIFFQHCKKAW